MPRAIHFLISIVSFAIAGCAATSREPVNLSTAKAEVEAYAKDDYDRDLAAVAGRAKSWVEKRSAQGGKLAIVFDIDETALSNLPHIREEDWGYQSDIWDKWVATGSASAILPVREVYRSALTRNVAVFFITGRRENEKAATARNLKAQGMGTYAKLIVKPESMPHRLPAADYKTPQRKLITEQGYTIIANIGDQKSDLTGGYAEQTFKLPNPFYLIP